MPRLFSYGMLQEEGVQRATFGRPLRGEPDELAGYELSRVPIDDLRVAAALGRTWFDNVVRSGLADSRVCGIVFEVSEAELAAADAFEVDAGYRRTLLELASGNLAWVYAYGVSLET